MKRIPIYRDLQNQQQWKGFATVTDDFLSEAGVARGQYKSWPKTFPARPC